MRGLIKAISISVASLIVLLSSAPALAVTPDPFCNPACALQKANDNLTLQIRYLITKIDTLKASLAAQDDTAVLDNLGDFCFTSTNEGAAECLARYQRFQVIALERMKNAVSQNQNSLATLKYKAESVESNQRSLDTLPVVPTLAEMQANFQKTSKKREKAEDFSKWARDMSRPPSMDDFVQFKEIPRDPDNKAAGMLTVVRTDPQGLADQKKAYDAAVATYKQGLGKQMQDDVVHINTNIGTGNQKITSLTITKPNDTTTKESQQSYKDARMDIIRAFAAKEVTVGGAVPGRQPAGSATGPLTGNEQIDPRVANDNREHIISYPSKMIESDIQEAGTAAVTH